MASFFSVNLSYQGKTIPLENLTTATTGAEFHGLVYDALQLSPTDSTLKVLLKGKRIEPDSTTAVFAKVPSNKPPKILVMASAKTSVEELNAKKQDPTIRGFDTPKTASASSTSYWGPHGIQPDKNYKFGRLQECPFHEFGHRPTDTTPHAFAARQLLQRLSTDPGVIAILQERQLVVGTLGEMDPIDDRLMQKKQQQHSGACLLGYNTNRGLRIDIKLRTDDLTGFRPYFQLVSTLIHELSHNWVGEHNTLFWANYGQMRLEYFMAHKRQQHALWNGQNSAMLAELPSALMQSQDKAILAFVQQELVQEMAQHHLHPNMIEAPLRQRYDELQATMPAGQRLGGSGTATAAGDKRNMALEAAERRAREQQRQKEENEKKGR
ncbi:Ubiquitin metalloprotease fusion protein [Seminavis robusta]|uniref:Ubiquitin metalloprotease fusion protein n=1 Tax=Seminavis robusta TaxID=568900 RepID=A0A9N8DKK6_9STRA|nr:Ubiquitin metalloprotease fusion protein [Seminavis robusta]|eukprot:Sro206_g086420.1 Ubiquitin metalloprotease fusion protein (381) ;mRNA; f:7254-8396